MRCFLMSGRSSRNSNNQKASKLHVCLRIWSAVPISHTVWTRHTTVSRSMHAAFDVLWAALQRLTGSKMKAPRLLRAMRTWQRCPLSQRGRAARGRRWVAMP